MIFLRRFDIPCVAAIQIKMDARKSPASLFEIRKQIVHLHKRGTGPMAIKEQTGISWGAIRSFFVAHKGVNIFRKQGRYLRPICYTKIVNMAKGAEQ